MSTTLQFKKNCGIVFDILVVSQILTVMSYLDYRCRKCNTDFHYQVPRPTIMKLLLGFLPIRIYWCPKCTTNRYVWIGNKKQTDYNHSVTEHSAVKKSA